MNNDYDNVNFDDMDEDEFFRVLWAAYFKMIDEYEGVMVLNPVQYAYFGRMRTLISETYGQHNGIIRTA
jgi:hypothetical protein